MLGAPEALAVGCTNMQLLLADETNIKSEKDVKFFLYGGLIIPFEAIPKIDKEIQDIKK
jgi:hypothetical protein